MKPYFSEHDLDIDDLKHRRTRAGLQIQQVALPEPPVEVDHAPVDGAPPPEPPLDPFRERQLGSWDLVDIAYLERGLACARAVCKLHARDDDGPFTGTGFLVSDRLLVTNEHNLERIEVAREATVEFEYERDLNMRPRASQAFQLRPDEAWWAHPELDVCVVAVAPTSVAGVPLSRYGSLRLDPNVGKVEEGDFVSLVHHPDGDYKQVAIRENRLLRKTADTLLYASDTGAGSSGAPCFSDRWAVVAVHRRGVPETIGGDPDRIKLVDGSEVTRAQVKQFRISEHRILWVANEGTRVSRLVQAIRAADLGNALVDAWLASLGPVDFGDVAPVSVGDAAPVGFVENRRPRNDYDQRNGYQADFLPVAVPVPRLRRALERWGWLAYNSDTGHSEFPYYNFSVWMNKTRRMAYLTATNIDGATWNERPRDEFGDDKWVFDDRLPERFQIGEGFYGSEPARYNKNYFDRGHLTRRTEPSWGSLEAARLANDDTFHFTNCTPQYKDFNQRSKYWQGLEQYLLEKGAAQHDLRLTLFTGPVFSDDDTLHRGVLVPRRFFKVACWCDDQDRLHSAAFVLDQTEWAEVIDFENAPVFDPQTSRVSIEALEAETLIDFGDAVRDADAAKGLDPAQIAQLPKLFG